MTDIILTQYSGKFIGPVAKLLGYVMDWIYIFLDSVFNIQNIGLCIIIFTLIIYLCLLPLTIRQQKFSKLTQKMQPEIDVVRKKYKDKKDQASVMAMNEETQNIYQKYGVSQAGSCIQMLIQMPILFALYRVIYNMPAYVTRVKEPFTQVVDGIMNTSGYQDTMNNFMTEIGLKTVSLNFSGTETEAANSLIDVLYKMPATAWDVLTNSFSSLSGGITELKASLDHMNFFLGINISNSPSDLLKEGWSTGQYLLVFGAILIPLLSAGTQFLNTKLMPTAPTSDNANDTMASSMKTMNYMMPLMSLVFVFTLPIGMGIYWIAGSAIRSVQQVIINRYVERIDLDEIIKKNQEKAKKKRAKKGIPENKISNTAHMNTRKLSEKATVKQNTVANSKEDKEEKLNQATEYSKNAKPGSLAAKANMVKEFNERKNK